MPHFPRLLPQQLAPDFVVSFVFGFIFILCVARQSTGADSDPSLPSTLYRCSRVSVRSGGVVRLFDLHPHAVDLAAALRASRPVPGTQFFTVTLRLTARDPATPTPPTPSLHKMCSPSSHDCSQKIREPRPTATDRNI